MQSIAKYWIITYNLNLFDVSIIPALAPIQSLLQISIVKIYPLIYLAMILLRYISHRHPTTHTFRSIQCIFIDPKHTTLHFIRLNWSHLLRCHRSYQNNQARESMLARFSIRTCFEYLIFICVTGDFDSLKIKMVVHMYTTICHTKRVNQERERERE